MTHTMPQTPSSVQPRLVGLLAQLESTRVPLPLKALEVEARVTGNLVSVQIDQLYLQDHPESLDCTYTFPLPADAAVHRCEMHVRDRVIEAKTMERDEARRVFEQQKNDGHRAALAEMDRENLFNLELGNLQPGDLIRIRLAYVQRLQTLDDLRSLRIPLTPGVRFVPGRPLPRANRGTGTVDDTDEVPDASRLSPPRIDALHPDAASFHAELTFDAGPNELVGLRSPSHAIEVRDNGETTSVTLGDAEAIPDRDLVLEWATMANTRTHARAMVTRHGQDRFALLELNGEPVPPEAPKETRDVYVLLDRSASMGGAPWEAACRAVASFAGCLPSDTRFDLTLFESNFTHFTDEPRPAGEVLKQMGDQASSLISLGVAGGTMLEPALAAVLARVGTHSRGRPATLLLLTDGMIANEQQVGDLAEQSGIVLNLVGIGIAPNDAMRTLAEKTGGQAVFCSPQDDLIGKVSRFASRLASPLFDPVHLPSGWSRADDRHELPLFPGEQRLILLRASGNGALGPVRAKRDEQTMDLEVEVRETGNPVLPLLWARERIRQLEGRGELEEAIRLSLQFNLPSSRTSFVAWDRKEKVTVATRHLHQPSQEVATGHLRESKLDELLEMMGSASAGKIPDKGRALCSYIDLEDYGYPPRSLEPESSLPPSDSLKEEPCPPKDRQLTPSDATSAAETATDQEEEHQTTDQPVTDQTVPVQETAEPEDAAEPTTERKAGILARLLEWLVGLLRRLIRLLRPPSK